MHLNPYRLIGTFILIVLILHPGYCQGNVKFGRLYGSDLGMGIGARAVSMGGAFVSVADDPSAVFWNPAGLTDLNGTAFFLSAETPEDFSSAVLTCSPDHSLFGLFKPAVALSFINRLRFRGDSGTGTWEGAPAHVLDLSMVDVGENYSGKADSNTHDVRVSLALTPEKMERISVGVNYMFIE